MISEKMKNKRFFSLIFFALWILIDKFATTTMCVVAHCYTFKQPIPIKEATFFINVTLISINRLGMEKVPEVGIPC